MLFTLSHQCFMYKNISNKQYNFIKINSTSDNISLKIAMSCSILVDIYTGKGRDGPLHPSCCTLTKVENYSFRMCYSREYLCLKKSEMTEAFRKQSFTHCLGFSNILKNTLKKF